MFKINFKLSNKWLYFGIIFLAAVLVMLPIAFFGIPEGHDLPQHFQFANAYYDSLMTGDGFPNLSSRENFGYGSIGIRFYPPFAYYTMAFFRIICGNWFDAAWVTFTFWMIVGCAGTYFWARWWLPEKFSAIAAVFYAFAPYHLNQLYTSFIYADFAGAGILPFCFAFQTRVFRRGRNSDILGLAFFYALLILTHLPSALIGSLCLGIYGLILIEKENAVKQLTKSAVAAFLGLAASSYYWTAMVSEMNWLNHATEKYQSGHYYFGDGFFPVYFFAKVPGELKDNLILTDMLLVFGFSFLASALVYVFYRRTKAAEKCEVSVIYKTVLPLGLFALFMITPLSYPIWKIITPLQKIQFPLRFMSVIMMCGSIIAAAAVHFFIKGDLFKKRRWLYSSIAFVVALLVLDTVYIFDPGAFVPIERAKFESEMRELPDKQNYDFWWAVWSKPDALKIREKVLAENRESAITDWKPEQRTFTVEAGTPVDARIATFYYPHWKAEVNGVAVPVRQDAQGVIIIPLPSEKANVNLYFQEPPLNKIASVISITVWLFLLTAFLLLWRKKFSFRKLMTLKLPEKNTHIDLAT